MSRKSARSKAYLQQRRRCFYCHFSMWDSDPKRFCATYRLSIGAAMRYQCTAEHLIARQDGGGNDSANIVAACRFCNQTRHRKRVPPAPRDYRALVRKRVGKGRWHPKEHHHLR